jgi:hypothetical protein
MTKLVEKEHLDNLGQILKVGDTVFYSHNLWRGRDEIRQAVILTLSVKSALVVPKIANYRYNKEGIKVLVPRRVNYTKIGKINA